MSAPAIGRVRVWDLPTRAVHWGMVGLFGFSWWSANAGKMVWHVAAGGALLAVIVFRLAWGFVGSETARFSSFVRGPVGVLKYARALLTEHRKGSTSVGQNPMGGWSVLAMLNLLLVQCGFGLFAVDVDGVASGPLARFVTFDLGRAAAEWHAVAFDGMLALLGLHLAAILFYALVRREHLLLAMITGAKLVRSPVRPPRFASPWLAAALAVAAGGAVTLLMMIDQLPLAAALAWLNTTLRLRSLH